MLLMDAYADAGYSVFGMDYFRDVGGNLLLLHHSFLPFSRTKSPLKPVINASRTRSGSTKKEPVTRLQIRTLTAQHGEISMSASQKPQSQNGLKASPTSMAKRPPNTVA